VSREQKAFNLIKSKIKVREPGLTTRKFPCSPALFFLIVIKKKKMENKNKNLEEKMEAEKDDATTDFANAAKPSAAIVNRGDKKAKNYKGGKPTVNGPNWDKISKNADGDTSQNAGVFNAGY
jgi:hypothetical protein